MIGTTRAAAERNELIRPDQLGPSQWPPTRRAPKQLSSRESDLHVTRDLSVEGGGNVTVGVEGERDGAVTQQFLNNLRMHTTSEEVSCCGVSQVVDPDSR